MNEYVSSIQNEVYLRPTYADAKMNKTAQLNLKGQTFNKQGGFNPSCRASWKIIIRSDGGPNV
jgi:hypothetical protein